MSKRDVIREAVTAADSDAEDKKAIERYLNNALVGAKADKPLKSGLDPITIVVSTPDTAHSNLLYEQLKQRMVVHGGPPIKIMSQKEAEVALTSDEESDLVKNALLLSAESPLPYPAIDPDHSHYSRRDRYLLKKERKAIKKRDPSKRWRT